MHKKSMSQNAKTESFLPYDQMQQKSVTDYPIPLLQPDKLKDL